MYLGIDLRFDQLSKIALFGHFIGLLQESTIAKVVIDWNYIAISYLSTYCGLIDLKEHKPTKNAG